MNEPAPTTVCRVCGTAFATQGDGFGEVCLGCLLGAALTSEDASESPLPVDSMPLRLSRLEVHGAHFAHYEISTHTDGTFVELGRGAMGVTYRAVDTVLHHEVALKVVAPEVAGNPQARARFLQEAQAAASLRHPHIASVFFFGERPTDRQLFYSMELIEGETLQARVTRAGGLPADTVLEIGTQVADALAAAEARGLTHRDLKPANVMLSQDEKVNAKVIDFGLAKTILTGPDGETRQTRAGEFVGTPAFASPEHFNVWQDTDSRSDFYALGATLWYALTGRVPFPGRTPAEVHDRQLHAALPVEQLLAARVPRPVVDLLRSLLSPDPDGRPQTARALAAALADCRQRVAGARPRRRRRAMTLVVSGLVLAGVAAGLIHQRGRTVPSPAPVPEKSIAVLPFDNLSADKNDAFFTNGVQDEILTDLARVEDLKVINPSSVLGYADPSKRPPAHEIGRALGVGYLLEGGVQRAGDRVRLTARLIDAARDREVWADRFDRKLSDVFAIQSEVADTIVGKLQVRLSTMDKATLDEPPTRDLTAYELFLHAKELGYNWDVNTSSMQPLFEEVRLLDEAISRDPGFYEALDQLASTHINLCIFKADVTPTVRQALIEETLGKMRRLRPDGGPTHLEAAYYHYKVTHDTVHGREELDRAQQKLPNNWRVLFITGIADYVDGRWNEAREVIEKQLPLNPRSSKAISQLVNLYIDLRLADEAERAENNAIAAGINPDFFALRHAISVMDQTGDTSEAKAYLQRAASASDAKGNAFSLQLMVAARERDVEALTRAVATHYKDAAGSDPVPTSYYAGYTAALRGDLAEEKKEYALSRPYFETEVNRRPENAGVWSDLGLVDSYSGRNDDAVREGLKAVSLAPISRDGAEGPAALMCLASIYAKIGDSDRALTLYESMENVPHGVTWSDLVGDFNLDLLRGTTRFEAIVQAVRKPVDLSKFNPADFPPPTPAP